MIKLKQQIWNRLIVFSVVFFFMTINYGCSSNINEYDLPLFAFSYPKKIAVKHIPKSNFRGILIFNRSDTAYYNFGYNISSLTERIPELVILPDVNNDEIDTISKNNHDYKRFTNDRNADLDRLKKQNLFYKYYKNQVWKYSMPIDTSKKGMLGLYIDSILIDKNGAVKFNFYFLDLKKLSYKEGQEIINSIRLKNNRIKNTDFYLTKIVE